MGSSKTIGLTHVNRMVQASDSPEVAAKIVIIIKGSCVKSTVLLSDAKLNSC